jgi:hypothetical protein
MIPSFVKVQQDGDAESQGGSLPLLGARRPDGEGLSPALLGLDSMASQRSNAANRGMVVELKFSSLRMQFVAL